MVPANSFAGVAPIDDLKPVKLEKLLRRHRNELAMRAKLKNVYEYRKQVLAIFDELVTRERTKERVH